MITTQVTWEYSIATQEQKDAHLAFEQARANPEVAAPANSSVHDELREKSTELTRGAGGDISNSEIEIDEDAEVVQHHYTRNWPDLASSQEWIAFVLAKGAKSAVIVE